MKTNVAGLHDFWCWGPANKVLCRRRSERSGERFFRDFGWIESHRELNGKALGRLSKASKMYLGRKTVIGTIFERF